MWATTITNNPAARGAALVQLIEQRLEQGDRLKKFSKNESAYIT
jgi:hypothetical protein